MNSPVVDIISPNFLNYKAGIKTQYRTKVNNDTKNALLEGERLYLEQKMQAKK